MDVRQDTLGGVIPMSDDKASSYIQMLVEFGPLFYMAFAIMMLKGMKCIKAGYMGATFVSRFVNLVMTSVVGAVLAVGAAALTPVIYPQATEGTLVGVTVVMAVGGIRLMDGLAYKHFGIHLVDSSELPPSESEWMTMSEDDRQACLKLWREHQKDYDNE